MTCESRGKLNGRSAAIWAGRHRCQGCPRRHRCAVGMSAQLAGHRKDLLIGSRVATDCDAQGLKAQASVEGCAGHLGVIQNTVAMPGALPWM